MILPANNNDSKMPDLSGLADMVTNILPSQSPSQDTASPLRSGIFVLVLAGSPI